MDNTQEHDAQHQVTSDPPHLETDAAEGSAAAGIEAGPSGMSIDLPFTNATLTLPHISAKVGGATEAGWDVAQFWHKPGEDSVLWGSPRLGCTRCRGVACGALGGCGDLRRTAHAAWLRPGHEAHGAHLCTDAALTQ